MSINLLSHNLILLFMFYIKAFVNVKFGYNQENPGPRIRLDHSLSDGIIGIVILIYCIFCFDCWVKTAKSALISNGEISKKKKKKKNVESIIQIQIILGRTEITWRPTLSEKGTAIFFFFFFQAKRSRETNRGLWLQFHLSHKRSVMEYNSSLCWILKMLSSKGFLVALDTQMIFRLYIVVKWILSGFKPFYH